MKLTEARALFNTCQEQGSTAFVIRRHCWADHLERQFSRIEILHLLLGAGHLVDNKYPSAALGSFLWFCKDKANRPVEVAVVFDDEPGAIVAVAISAYRETSK